MTVDARLMLRIAAICTGIYVVFFVALQIYLPYLLHGDQLPATTSGHLDANVAALLRFVQSHRDYFSIGYDLVAINYLFLLGAVGGTFLLLRALRPRAAQVVLAIGILSIVGVIVSQLVADHQWLDSAAAYSKARGTAAATAAVHTFEQQSGGYQFAYLISTTGIAVWLALLGVTFLRLQSTRSLIGWGTIAAGLLLLSQFPSLPIWALGAAIGLWRVGALTPPGVSEVRWNTGGTTAAAAADSTSRQNNVIEGETIQRRPSARPAGKRKRR